MANYKEDIIDIDLQTGTVHRSFLNHTLGSGDEKANRFGVRTFRNGEPESISNACYGYFIRADGSTVGPIEGVISGANSNKAYVTLPEACYAIEGAFSLAIKVTTSSTTGTLRIVDGIVSKTTTETIVDPGTVVSSVDDLVQAIENAIEAIPEDYTPTLANAFASGTANEWDSYVLEDGKFYRLPAGHAANVAWSSTTKEQTKVGTELENLNNKALRYCSVSESEATSVYSNTATNLKGNTFSYVLGSWFNDLPYDSGVGWIATLAGKENHAGSFATQIYIKLNHSYDSADQNEASVAFRSKINLSNNLWSGWTYESIERMTGNQYKPATGTYEAGDIVLNKGQMNINKKPISTAEAFTAAKWTQMPLFEFLQNKVLKYQDIDATAAEEIYDEKMTNLYGNTVSYVSPTWFDDAPPTENAGFIISLSYQKGKMVSTSFVFKTQIFISGSYGVMYTRNKIRYTAGTGDEWSDWKLVNEDLTAIRNKGAIPEEITDMNDLTEQGIYYRAYVSAGNELDNSPTAGYTKAFQCLVLVQTPVTIQIVFGLEGDMYTRWYIAASGWHGWYTMSGSPHVASRVLYSFGDSTTYGQIGGTGGQSSYNYPAMIGKLLQMGVQNKAVGGQGLLKDWDTIHTNYIDNLDMTDASLITVGWAYNDNYTTIPFGAYTDTTDSSYIGKYFTIMKEFQQKCPTAQVILITGFGSPTGGQIGPPVVIPNFERQFTQQYTFSDSTHTVKEMYDTLEQMCNLHGWACVNQSKGCAINQYNCSTLIGDQIHPNNTGYIAYSNMIAARVAALYANVG